MSDITLREIEEAIDILNQIETVDPSANALLGELEARLQDALYKISTDFGNREPRCERCGASSSHIVWEDSQ